MRVEIVNAMRAGAVREASGHRHGIPGMRERAQLTGGTLHADVAGERFRLVAEIPATAAAPDAPATTPSGRNA